MDNKFFPLMAVSLFGGLSCSVMAADISQDELLKRMRSAQKPLLIDVRTPKEYAQGHVPGAINIPHKDMKKHLATANLDKNTTIVLYCRSGTRAGIAKKVLQKGGYHQLDHLTGDFIGWDASGLPQIKGSNARNNKVTVANPCGL